MDGFVEVKLSQMIIDKLHQEYKKLDKAYKGFDKDKARPLVKKKIFFGLFTKEKRIIDWEYLDNYLCSDYLHVYGSIVTGGCFYLKFTYKGEILQSLVKLCTGNAGRNVYLTPEQSMFLQDLE